MDFQNFSDFNRFMTRQSMFSDSRENIIFFLGQAIHFNRKICLEKEAIWTGNLIRKRKLTNFETVKENIDFALNGNKIDLEYLLKGLMSDYETTTGNVFDKDTYEKIKKLCSRQGTHEKYKTKNKEKKPSYSFIKDEYMYSLITCEMILEAGANIEFFTVDGMDIVKKCFSVESAKQINIANATSKILFGEENSPTYRKRRQEALDKEKLQYKSKRISKKGKQKLRDSSLYGDDFGKSKSTSPYSTECYNHHTGKEFIKDLESLFKYHQDKNRVSKFNFSTGKRLHPPKNKRPHPPKSFISYLIENIV